MKLNFRNILLILLTVLVTFGALFYIWASNSSKPMPEALKAMVSDDIIRVSTERWYVFEPISTAPTTGFIFYPGGKVDAAAYAPMMKKIAEAGYLAVIVPMPLNLAVFDGMAAEDVIVNYPAIQHWAIGGHSLGGVVASSFAASNEAIDGLVLWASYPASGEGIVDSDLFVASISGSADGLSTPEKIENSRSMLPTNTYWTEIPGGNHAQFGFYGEQSGDNPAQITREQQLSQIVEATVAILKNISR